MRTLVSELANAVWHLLFIKLFQLYSVFQEFVNFIAYCSKKNNKTIIGIFCIINLYLLFKHKKQLQRRQHYCTTIHTNLCICIKVDVHTKQTINWKTPNEIQQWTRRTTHFKTQRERQKQDKFIQIYKTNIKITTTTTTTKFIILPANFSSRVIRPFRCHLRRVTYHRPLWIWFGDRRTKLTTQTTPNIFIYVYVYMYI